MRKINHPHIVKNFALIFLAFALVAMAISCRHHHVRAYQYNINAENISPGCYSLTIDGEYFFYFNEGWLIRVELASKTQDSTFLNIDGDRHVNLLSQREGVSVLSFDKKEQYNESMIKKVDLINLDIEMNPIDTFQFLTIARSHLLVEDFKFVSVYIDRQSKSVSFNDEFSRMLVIENSNWSFRGLLHSAVDPITGLQYKLQASNPNNSAPYFFGNNKNTILLDENAQFMPSQFSIFNGKPIYYTGQQLVFQGKRKNAHWRAETTKEFNPCRRYEKGLFRYDDRGVLYFIELY
jgi:hypothetical protein